MTITKWKLTFSNKQLKSTWTTSPVLVSKRIFSPCRSPSLVHVQQNNTTKKTLECLYPRINPTIDITAAVRPYVNLLANHAVGSGKVSINHSWKTGIKLCSRSKSPRISHNFFYTHIDKIFSLKETATSWSVISLTRLKYSPISPDFKSWSKARTTRREYVYPAFYTPCFIVLHNYRSDRNGVRDPLDKTTFLIESYNTVRSDV